MNSMYDVINSRGIGLLIAADSENQAVAVARKTFHIKVKPRYVNTIPFTDWSRDTGADSLLEILNSGKSGTLSKRVTAYTFEQVFGLKPKPPRDDQWQLNEVRLP